MRNASSTAGSVTSGGMSAKASASPSAATVLTRYSISVFRWPVTPLIAGSPTRRLTIRPQSDRPA